MEEFNPSKFPPSRLPNIQHQNLSQQQYFNQQVFQNRQTQQFYPQPVISQNYGYQQNQQQNYGLNNFYQNAGDIFQAQMRGQGPVQNQIQVDRNLNLNINPITIPNFNYQTQFMPNLSPTQYYPVQVNNQFEQRDVGNTFRHQLAFPERQIGTLDCLESNQMTAQQINAEQPSFQQYIINQNFQQQFQMQENQQKQLNFGTSESNLNIDANNYCYTQSHISNPSNEQQPNLTPICQNIIQNAPMQENFILDTKNNIQEKLLEIEELTNQLRYVFQEESEKEADGSRLRQKESVEGQILLNIEMQEIPTIKHILPNLFEKPIILDREIQLNIHLLENISQLNDKLEPQVEYFLTVQFSERVINQLLNMNFTHIREVKADGNSYYRAVGYLYLETLILSRKIEPFRELLFLVSSDQEVYYLDSDQLKEEFLAGIALIIDHIKKEVSQHQLYNLLQRMFILNSMFNEAMIFFIRRVTQNFLQMHSSKSINTFPIATLVQNDAQNLDEYINDILMNMAVDAEGSLLWIIPIVFRINIFIVKIKNSVKENRKPSLKLIKIEEFKSKYPDIHLFSHDNLNLHDEKIYLLKKDDHYCMIYNKNQQQFENIEQLINEDKEMVETYKKYKNSDQNEYNIEALEEQKEEIIENQVNLEQASVNRNFNKEKAQEDVIYLQCCEQKIQQKLINLMFQPVNEEEWFVIDGKFQKPACPICYCRMKCSDLLQLFPEQEEIIRQLYKDDFLKKEELKQINYDKKEKREENKMIAIENENYLKCSKCQTKVDPKLVYRWPICNCIYHKKCVYEMIDYDTQSIFFAFEDNKISQKKTFCQNQNCPEMPPSFLSPQECKMVFQFFFKGSVFDYSLVKDNNQKKESVQMKCGHWLIIERFKKQIEKGVITLHVYKSNSDQKKSFQNLYLSKFVKAEEGTISLKCTLCETFSDSAIFFKIFKFNNKSDKNAYTQMFQLQSSLPFFKCFNCIASLFFNSSNGYLVQSCSRELSHLIKDIESQFEIEYMRINNRESTKLKNDKDFTDQIQKYFQHSRHFCEHNEELTIYDYLKIKERDQASSSVFAQFSMNYLPSVLSSKDKKYYPSFLFSAKCPCGNEIINKTQNQPQPLCPQKYKLCQNCFDKQFCIGCNQLFSQTNTFCFSCRRVKEEREIIFFIQSCKKTKICLDCFSKFIVSISDDNQQKVQQKLSQVLNCQIFQQINKIITKYCGEPHWLNLRSLSANIEKVQYKLHPNPNLKIITNFYTQILESSCVKHPLEKINNGIKQQNSNQKRSDINSFCISCSIEIYKNVKTNKQKQEEHKEESKNVEQQQCTSNKDIKLPPQLSLQQIDKISTIKIVNTGKFTKDQFLNSRSVALTILKSRVVFIEFVYPSKENNENLFLLDYLQANSPLLDEQLFIFQQLIENQKQEAVALQRVIFENQTNSNDLIKGLELKLESMVKSQDVVCSNCFQDYPNILKYFWCENCCLICEKCSEQEICNNCLGKQL